MYFWRRLRVYRVEQKFMLLFCHAVLESIVIYWTTSWYSNLKSCWKNLKSCLVQTAMKMLEVKKQQLLWHTRYVWATALNNDKNNNSSSNKAVCVQAAVWKLSFLPFPPSSWFPVGIGAQHVHFKVLCARLLFGEPQWTSPRPSDKSHYSVVVIEFALCHHSPLQRSRRHLFADKTRGINK